MIIASAHDYRQAARLRLPRFLFDYLDGGANAELTLKANCADIAAITLRQRILQNIGEVSLNTEILGRHLALPIILSPVGITGMYARRGEIQAARAACVKGIPFVQSTLSICSLEEVVGATPTPPWFQLYVLKDRGFMTHILERAQAAGITTLVFTVDMPVPGSRYRDAHSGMAGPFASQRRIFQAVTKLQWAWEVGFLGRPHTLGNISSYLGEAMGLAHYMDWLKLNFDPTISWSDLLWIREFWRGPMLIKGILDPADARAALSFGADGIVVSNHGGRQLDSVCSTAKALPDIVEAVGGLMTILVDSGIRSGIDVLKMLALGAQGVMIGRSAVYALASRGQQGVEHLLDLYANELKVAMTLSGVQAIGDINRSILIQDQGAWRACEST